ncbi:hypothetical protein BLNAU_24379 [Blattamonas nauphoetae]|uniref:Uncharacterized protein n=1 Tax=Blattamonas nauphoetae TaxID=2049346 RepID=A0ABQ9WMJ7_9EUKA|nr:hypothetical protein BLNAU_24379 [Blattamonas nauphoetae]
MEGYNIVSWNWWERHCDVTLLVLRHPHLAADARPHHSHKLQHPVACAVTLLGLRITRVCSPFSSDRKPSLNLFLALQLPFHRMNLSTPNRLHVAVGFNTAQVAIPATDGTVLRLSYLQSF